MQKRVSGWGALSFSMSGLRSCMPAIWDFGEAAKIDENRVGLRTSASASRRFTPISSKPKLKNQFSMQLF